MVASSSRSLQWNSVTSLAVTCHAWMTPVDRLLHVVGRLEAATARKYVEVCAAVLVTTLEQLQKEQVEAAGGGGGDADAQADQMSSARVRWNNMKKKKDGSLTRFLNGGKPGGYKADNSTALSRFVVNHCFGFCVWRCFRLQKRRLDPDT